MDPSSSETPEKNQETCDFRSPITHNSLPPGEGIGKKNSQVFDFAAFSQTQTSQLPPPWRISHSQIKMDRFSRTVSHVTGCQARRAFGAAADGIRDNE